jgi:hypothetical protein
LKLGLYELLSQDPQWTKVFALRSLAERQKHASRLIRAFLAKWRTQDACRYRRPQKVPSDKIAAFDAFIAARAAVFDGALSRLREPGTFRGAPGTALLRLVGLTRQRLQRIRKREARVNDEVFAALQARSPAEALLAFEQHHHSSAP